MIHYTGAVDAANGKQIDISLFGDGSSSSVAVDVSKNPIGVDFKSGNLPVGIIFTSGTSPSGYTVTNATVSGTVVTFTLSGALPVWETLTCTIILGYNS